MPVKAESVWAEEFRIEREKRRKVEKVLEGLRWACERMLARLETETDWLVAADYPPRFLVERREHLMAYSAATAKAKEASGA